MRFGELVTMGLHVKPPKKSGGFYNVIGILQISLCLKKPIQMRQPNP